MEWQENEVGIFTCYKVLQLFQVLFIILVAASTVQQVLNNKAELVIGVKMFAFLTFKRNCGQKM